MSILLLNAYIFVHYLGTNTITALASATVILTLPPVACSKVAEGGRELWIPGAREASERVTFYKFCKNVASAVILYVHKRAKMAMLVIAFEDLKKPVETSYSGYCASHPPLALPENLESRRYREVWFLDTLFFLPFRHR